MKNKIIFLAACLSIENQAEGKQIAIFEAANEPNKPNIKGLFSVVQWLEEDEIGFVPQQAYKLTLEQYEAAEPLQFDDLPKNVQKLVTTAETLEEAYLKDVEKLGKDQEKVTDLKQVANEAAEEVETLRTTEGASDDDIKEAEQKLETAVEAANKAIVELEKFDAKIQKAEVKLNEAKQKSEEAIAAIEVK